MWACIGCCLTSNENSAINFRRKTNGNEGDLIIMFIINAFIDLILNEEMINIGYNRYVFMVNLFIILQLYPISTKLFFNKIIT